MPADFNPIVLIDGYKTGHHNQFVDGLEYIESNFTPRGSKIPGVNEVVFFGLQAFLEQYLTVQFANFFADDAEFIASGYSALMNTYLGPDNTVGTDHIVALRDLGYLPLEFKALPEGSLVPLRVPMFTVTNTHPDFAWLVNYIETMLSASIWMPCTTATNAYRFRKMLEKWAAKTGADTEMIKWQGHDFSFRGMGSVEAAVNSGMGHLTSFAGTDTIPAGMAAGFYYPGEEPVLYGSVGATEHSVMMSAGKDNEDEMYRRLIEEIHPTGIVSLVSDTWNLWRVLTETLPGLKDSIMNREGKVVVRPDCYDEQTSVFTNSGWKLFADLNDNDLVAQVLEDGTYEFTKPLKYVNQEYKGYMVKFNDDKGKCDLLVTPNHRMLWKRRSGNKVVEAGMSTVGSNDSKMYRSAKASSYERQLTSLERLKIAFQADGSYPSKLSKEAVSGERSYRFNFSKERKIERLEKICADGGFRYSIHDEQARENQKTLYVWLPENEPLVKDFSWINTSDLCSDWCQEFIEELSYWDATRRSDGRFKFDTTVPEVMEVVELVALSAGYGCLVSHRTDERQEHFSDVYTAHILKDNLLGSQAIQKEYEWYEGTIHCVTVPSGMLMVKRNRATAVCGNSGDPADIICGLNTAPNYFDYMGDHPAVKGVIELLWDEFGGTVNEAGYKELDPHVGCIYGDAINYDKAEEILSRLASKGFSSGNIVFGCGSYGYQYVTRDTFGFAMKSTWAQVNGESVNLHKDPVTDNGLKKSATGRVAVLRNKENNRAYYLYDNAPDAVLENSHLKTVWKDGKFVQSYTFNEIRNRLHPEGF